MDDLYSFVYKELYYLNTYKRNKVYTRMELLAEPQSAIMINKLNEEFEQVMDISMRLEKENKVLRKLAKDLDKLKAPSIVESSKDKDGYCSLEEDLRTMFLEICGGDDDNDEVLSDKLLEDYGNFRPGKPLLDGSIIKRIVDELNKATGHQKPDWCLTKVIKECEDRGYDDEWMYNGPRICIYELASDLSNFLDFKLPTVYKYVS